MSIEISKSHNDKCAEIYLGDVTLLFSYETLVGFAVPGVGRVKSENVWGPTTGKHLNSWPAKFEKVPRETFKKAATELDKSLSGYGTRDGLIKRLNRILSVQDD